MYIRHVKHFESNQAKIKMNTPFLIIIRLHGNESRTETNSSAKRKINLHTARAEGDGKGTRAGGYN
jgi:hypothetical protein